MKLADGDEYDDPSILYCSSEKNEQYGIERILKLRFNIYILNGFHI